MRKLIPLALVYLFILGACKTNDTLDTASRENIAGGMAVLAVFNGVEGTDQMDILLDGERQNTGIEDLRYGEILRHRTVYPGDRRLTVNMRLKNQSTTPFTTNLRLLPGKNYSLFLTAGEPVKFHLVEDDLILPTDGQYKVRLANTSADGIAVELGTLAHSSQYFSAVQANSLTGFSTFDLAQQEVWHFAAQGLAEHRLPLNFKPVNREVYTIWLTGSISGHSDELGRAAYTVIKHP